MPLWDIETHEKLDKDRFRRDLGGVEDAYAEMIERQVLKIMPNNTYIILRLMPVMQARKCSISILLILSLKHGESFDCSSCRSRKRAWT